MLRVLHLMVNSLKYVNEVRYLGFKTTDKLKDDAELFVSSLTERKVSKWLLNFLKLSRVKLCIV